MIQDVLTVRLREVPNLEVARAVLLRSAPAELHQEKTMKEPMETVGGYTTDLVAVMRHVHDAMERHVQDERVHRVLGARGALLESIGVLDRGMHALEIRARENGGGGAGQVKEVAASITGFLTGLYGQARGETVARMMRDDSTGLHFVMVCTAMLHTTAVGLGDVRTAETAAGILRELPRCHMRVKELLPYAVVAELKEQHPEMDRAAAETTVHEMVESWRAATMTTV